MKDADAPGPGVRESISLPTDVLADHGLTAGQPVVIERLEDGLLLLPALPDAKRIYIEPTTRCNLTCQTCLRHSWTEPIGEMDFALFERALHQLDGLPDLQSVHFAGFGEPMCHPRLAEMIERVSARGLRAEMTTNALLLDEGRARELIASGLHTVVVSIDGARPATFGAVRTGGELSTVVENVRRLARLKRELGSPGPRVGFAFVAMKSNYRELPDILRLAMDSGVSFLIVSNLMPYTEAMVPEALYGNGSVDLPVSTWYRWRWGFARIQLPNMEVRTDRQCRFVGNSSFVLAWDGKVSPCYAFTHGHTEFVLGRRKEVRRWVMGDLRERSLAEIWADPEYVRFRSRVRRNAFPSCSDCATADACYFSQSNEADCWGNSPSCGDCLWARGIIKCF